MDIRNYFTVLNKKNVSEADGSKTSSSKSRTKKTKRILDSDEEDLSHNSSDIICLDDSDDAIFTSRNKKAKQEKSKMAASSNSKPWSKSPQDVPTVKPVSAASYFGAAPVLRHPDSSCRTTGNFSLKRKVEDASDNDTKLKKTPKLVDEESGFTPKKAKLSPSSSKNHSSNFSSPSAELSERIENQSHSSNLVQLPVHLEKTVIKVESKNNSNKSSGKLSLASKVSNRKLNQSNPVTEEPNIAFSKNIKTESMQKSNQESPRKSSQVTPKKGSVLLVGKNIKKTPKQNMNRKDSVKEESHEAHIALNLNSPDLFDETVIETPEDVRKRKAAAYRKYQQRRALGPRNPGSKAIPEGEPGCLSGLVFVQTGILESLDRVEMDELLQRYGARVVSAVSKKTTHLIVGDDAGASKSAKAAQFGTKIVSEDDVLEMIRTRPGRTVDDADEQVSKVSKTESKKSFLGTSTNVPPFESERGSHFAVSAKTNVSSSPDTIPSPSVPSQRSQSAGHGSESGCSTQSTQPITSQVVMERGAEELLWVDKYKPSSLKNIIGQQGDKSIAQKLLKWLRNWTSNHDGHRKLTRPSPWAKDYDGSFYKAALLSGPPGVGKTTTAQLVAKELGFDIVELNASDTRSKRLLTEEVSQLLTNTSLLNFAAGNVKNATTRKHVLLMDEVDGMAGNEDRGGVQELIMLLKNTRVPVICMCNDRQHPKIRSLANHCFDLRFYKPRLEQIRGAMMSVCYREGLKIKPDALDRIILGSNQDVRQILHHLFVFSAKEKTLSLEQACNDANQAKKDIKIGPWDVCRQVFSESERKNMNIHQKCELFFFDYSIGPLFVQENYWKARPASVQSGNRVALLKQLALAARSIADGDLVERAIRSGNTWSLLPTQAVFSCVLPGEAMSGHLGGEIDFPAWLGNNSKKNKMDRLAQELHMHMRLKMTATKRDVAMEYCGAVRRIIIKPLVDQGLDGITDAVAAVNDYSLIREDLDSLSELALWSGAKDAFTSVDSKVKAGFTRALKKSAALQPYSLTSGSKKKRGSVASSYELQGDSGTDEVDSSSDDDLAADILIKAKKAAGKASTGVANSRSGGCVAAHAASRGRGRRKK